MGKNTNMIKWVFIIAAGSIMGNIIGNVLSRFIPFLSLSESIGLTPATLDLSFLTVTFGFNVSLNLAGIIGIIIVVLIFRKM